MNAVGQRRFRNILIAGMPGVGKSTFAKAYAQMSRTEYVELDTYVEKIAGKSIAEIFAQDGEAVFRDLESQCLERLMRRQRCTIALGGGTLTNPQSLELARALGCVVWLTAPVTVIAARVWPVKDKRPLLADCASIEQLTARLEELLEKRRPSYEAADVVLETTYSSIDTLKIELSWLEKQILARRALPLEKAAARENNPSDVLEDGQVLLRHPRRIPLADASYRSPRENRTGKDPAEKMERLIKAQRQKDRTDRAEKRERSDKREKRPTTEAGPVPAAQSPQVSRPQAVVRERSQQNLSRGKVTTGGGAAVNDGPQPRAARGADANGPTPRANRSDRGAGDRSAGDRPTPRAVRDDGQERPVPGPSRSGAVGAPQARPQSETQQETSGPVPRQSSTTQSN
jgi:shikimate kinase